MTPEEFQKVIDNTYFPTLTVPPTAHQRGPERGKPGPLRIAPFVSAPAYEIIKDVQPYTWAPHADIHPLARLAELSNQDKHQAIHFTPLRLDAVTAIGAVSSIIDGRLEPVALLDDGIKLRFVAEHEVDVNADVTIRVAFEDSPPFMNRSPIFDRLIEIRDFVVDVAERLGPFI